MSADLPPDVRDRAANIAYDAWLEGFYGPDPDEIKRCRAGGRDVMDDCCSECVH